MKNEFKALLVVNYTTLKLFKNFPDGEKNRFDFFVFRGISSERAIDNVDSLTAYNRLI